MIRRPDKGACRGRLLPFLHLPFPPFSGMGYQGDYKSNRIPPDFYVGVWRRLAMIHPFLNLQMWHLSIYLHQQSPLGAYPFPEKWHKKVFLKIIDWIILREGNLAAVEHEKT